MSEYGNGFAEYRRLIMDKLGDHGTILEDVRKELVDIRLEQRTQKVKQNLISSLTSALTVGLIFLVKSQLPSAGIILGKWALPVGWQIVKMILSVM